MAPMTDTFLLGGRSMVSEVCKVRNPADFRTAGSPGELQTGRLREDWRTELL